MARILLAEDDESMRRFLGAALAKAGHAVDTAPDGPEALDRLRASHYDLLVADVIMPGMDGIEVARRATIDKPLLKVMFITGFAAVAMARLAQSQPGAKLLSKPFHLRQLVDQVETLLAA